MTTTMLDQTLVNDKNLAASFDEIVAIGASDLCATSKYVATLMIATGKRSATDLIEISGLKRTTIYRSLADIYESSIAGLFEAILTSPTRPTNPTDGIPTSPTDGNNSQKPVPLVPSVGISDQEPSCARDITTRATKELPSEVSSNEDIYSPSSVPPTPKTKPKRAIGTRLSADWELPPEWLQWTLINFVTANEASVRAEAEQFRDFWISKTGQSATKLDWQATWRNWCRNSKSLTRINSPRPYSTGRMAYDEQQAAEIAKLRDFVARRGRGEEVAYQ